MTDQIAAVEPAPKRDLALRIAEFYRRTTASRSALALVIANAIPLVGVLLFGWSLWTILVLYWLDNGITGFWTIPKILMARGSLLAGIENMAPSADNRQRTALRMLASTQATSATMEKAFGRAVEFGQAGRVGLAAFFLIHYGMFWFVHGIFVFALPMFFPGSGAPCVEPLGQPTNLPPGFPAGIDATCGASPFGEISATSVLIGGIALFVSHGYSYFRNYLGSGENLRTSAAAQMGAPYGRVVVLHLTILLGAFGVAFLGATEVQLIIFVVLKTLFDLGLHLRQHDPDRPAVLSAGATA